MNERIKQLAEQANKEVWGNNPYNGAPEFEGYLLDQEKFAELIVMECVGICDDVQRRYGQYTFTATKVKEEIKERFGVEK